METTKVIELDVIDKALVNLKSTANHLGYGTGSQIIDNVIMLLNGFSGKNSASVADAFEQVNHNIINNDAYDDLHELADLGFDIVMNDDFDKKQVRDAIIKVIDDINLIIK